VRNFKFLSDNDDSDDDILPLDDNRPSWMWISSFPQPPENHQPEVMITHHEGIRDFLGMFPDHTIVPVLKITGYNGVEERVHTGVEEYPDGWGFDITSDLLTIQWVRYNDI
jgi:hypothetical protein